MKKYPAYKDSGLAWVGEIPEHWTVQKGKRLFKRMDRPVRESDEVVTAFRDGTVTLRSNRRVEGFTNSIQEIGYQGVRKGDLVIHAMDGFAGAIGVSDSDGKSTPVYAVCQPITDVNAHYYAYLLRRMAQSGYIVALARGIRERSTEFRFVEFANLEYPVPPLDEQNAIVKYLKDKLFEVDHFINNKLRLIELLQEQRAAIINRAVTCGINPNARFKPSGIEGLGDIPDGWEIKRLRYLAEKIGSGVTPRGGAQVYQSSGIPLLRSQNVHFDGLRLDEVAYISEEMHQSMRGSTVKPNDVLLNITGASIGRSCFVPAGLGEANVNQHVCIIRPREDISSEYLSHFLASNFIQLQIWLSQNGASREGLNYGQLKAFPILLPPLEEQFQITSVIREETANIRQAITKAEREIDLIKEFRTTLISDVVTGKIDVRKSEATVLTFKSRQVTPQFKRALLAAEIIYQQYQDKKFGRIKFQKLLYLCEYYAQLDEINSNYLRHAAGPYDSRMLYQIEAQLKKSKWFGVTGDRGEQHNYLPLEKAGEHRKYFDKHWGQHRLAIQNVINLLQPLDWERSEIVATLFAAWNDLILMKESVTDDKIISEVLNWHERKRRIPEARWRRALDWMREKNLVPKGYGKLTGRRKQI